MSAKKKKLTLKELKKEQEYATKLMNSVFSTKAKMNYEYEKLAECLKDSTILAITVLTNSMTSAEIKSLGIVGSAYTKLKNEPEKMKIETLSKIYFKLDSFYKNKI